ncbi:hypothetical protein MNEG_13503 [Monoraphidium neglectum]|uniref:Uncharacterized protein n=1 Tax=Monoraphidium neglectum TaxID=145388 RepID=A0A0D2LRZ8_9CHLO|nr:hypothetical protein MNEG_13503 [Monoraphidium neglectum]KIY94459.1 hypothetical protein MNEG_13503 [Monoraphidium neglectum]|eukprot:XP_013893479.1 hypothetical protein MNEG_13503 [Monoraphidium neglectum]
MSLGAYFSSLQPQGAFSYERAVVSAADKYGLTAALPLAVFLPAAWRRDDDVGGLLRSFPGLSAGRALQAAVSTLDMVAFGQTVHQYAARTRRHEAEARAGPGAHAADHHHQQQQQQHVEPSWWRLRAPANPQLPPREPTAAGRAAQAALREEGPLHLLLQGGKAPPAAATGAAPLQLPNPLLLTPESVLGLLGITPEAAADTSPVPGPEPRPASQLLPDLCIGNGGLHLTFPAAGTAVCGLMAQVFNRLTGNAMRGLPRAPGLLPEGSADDVTVASPFLVRVTPDGPAVSTVEDLVRELEGQGYEIEITLRSNITSFSYGLSVRAEDGGWLQVPIAYPLRTGLWARDERGRTLDVLTLMPHASVVVSVTGGGPGGRGGGDSGGPDSGGGGGDGAGGDGGLLPDFALEWCLNINGFTGWGSYSCLDRAWAAGAPFQTLHNLGDLSAAAARQRAVRMLTAATVVVNAAGQRDRLLFGGYGYLGVCLDSAAAIQQALTGGCSLYPLILGGDAKMGLIAAYQDAQAASAATASAAGLGEARGDAAGGGGAGCDKHHLRSQGQQPQRQQQQQQQQQRPQTRPEQADGAAAIRADGAGGGGGAAADRWEYASEAAALQAAVAALPCDAIQEPRRAADAARRALACLPERSAFSCVGACRAALRAARDAAERLCPGG